ncbi:arsenic resistance operon repressor [Intrasporangium chromatireducens Q5-1]|uniref:Arsenic resistance operon repressor n=1 Tax=Intrasporangium chromatireducens Q5-1 TaxID=584657 RepID=W9GKF9_9MICO|nr:arsenite efflux transporter metallochaperone ArsD [Intrasporangium chromatireducens]EWT05602.1 arsenic resistance operon repressor [Intrasporangium chromatireducens Q5-1]
MPDVHVYEPALCCQTGVCGPDLDQTLVTFTADLANVADAGGSVWRHNLASDPDAFVRDEGIRAFLHLAGSEGLPVTTVDGVTVLTGRYPSREQLQRFAGVSTGTGDPSPAEQGTRAGLPLVTASTGPASSCAPGPGEGCC